MEGDPNQVEGVHVGTKGCTFCLRILPVECFSWHRKGKSRTTWCGACCTLKPMAQNIDDPKVRARTYKALRRFARRLTEETELVEGYMTIH